MLLLRLHTHTHTHTHTHIHRYIHTHIHTHTWRRVEVFHFSRIIRCLGPPRGSQVPGLLPGHLRNMFVWFWGYTYVYNSLYMHTNTRGVKRFSYRFLHSIDCIYRAMHGGC